MDLAATVDKVAQASLFSAEGYGAGTVDDTFPGDVTIKDTKIEVRLNPADIRDFPDEFDWRLATTLRALPNETDSPRSKIIIPTRAYGVSRKLLQTIIRVQPRREQRRQIRDLTSSRARQGQARSA